MYILYYVILYFKSHDSRKKYSFFFFFLTEIYSTVLIGRYSTRSSQEDTYICIHIYIYLLTMYLESGNWHDY